MKVKQIRPIWSLILLSPTVLAEPYTLTLEQDPFAEWNIDGSNTIRAEWYDFSGNPAGNPHSFLNEQVYDEFNLNFSRQFSTYNKVNGQVFGVLSDSDYRTSTEGLLIERASINWQKGDSTIPFKLELGDFYGFYSQRTVNTSLKGGQLELQPSQSWLGEQHSFSLMAGSRVADYRDSNDFSDQLFVGASWLMHHEALDIALNYVGHHTDSAISASNQNLWQNLLSLSGQHTLQLSDLHRINFNAEIAYFFGELENSGYQHASGSYLQIQGTREQLDYGFRYERYEEDFRPAGGSVTAGQQTLELTAGWRFQQGVNTSMRLQHFTNNLQSINPVDTSVAGLNISGALPNDLWPGMSMSLDTFMQNSQDRNDTSHTRNYSTNININAPITQVWSGRAGFIYNLNRNILLDQDTSANHQLTLGAGRAWQVGEVNGSLDLGANVRHSENGANDTVDFSPLISVNGNYRAHRFSLSYNALRRETLFDDQQNLVTHALSMLYGWSQGPHNVTIDADLGLRDPSNEGDTEHFRAGLTYTFAFSKPKAAKRVATQTTLAISAPNNTRSARPADLDFIALQPGMDMEKTYALLEANNLTGATPFPGGLFFETRYLQNVRQRQRLALAIDGQTLQKAALVVDLSGVGDLFNIARIYDNVREEITRKYGQPQLFERGQFSNDIHQELVAGSFIRIAEWKTKAGTLRLGIPRRNDGQVRIELQHARDFAPPTELRWSLEELR